MRTNMHPAMQGIAGNRTESANIKNEVATIFDQELMSIRNQKAQRLQFLSRTPNMSLASDALLALSDEVYYALYRREVMLQFDRDLAELGLDLAAGPTESTTGLRNPPDNIYSSSTFGEAESDVMHERVSSRFADSVRADVREPQDVPLPPSPPPPPPPPAANVGQAANKWLGLADEHPLYKHLSRTLPQHDEVSVTDSGYATNSCYTDDLAAHEEISASPRAVLSGSVTADLQGLCSPIAGSGGGGGRGWNQQ